MKGLAQLAWRPASPWCPLLGHLRPSTDMANCETLSDSIPYTLMAKPPTRLCHGLSSSPCRNAAVHAFAPGIQMQRNIKKTTHPQVGVQRVRAKAGMSCMEQIHGPGHEGNWFQAQCF